MRLEIEKNILFFRNHCGLVTKEDGEFVGRIVKLFNVYIQYNILTAISNYITVRFQYDGQTKICT